MDPWHGIAFPLDWMRKGYTSRILGPGADPERFFRPPYVGHRGWLGVRLDGAVDWDEVAGIVEDAWATVAPARLLAQLRDK